MSEVVAVFPSLGKTTLCSDCYNNDIVDRVKFLDLDYHYFKKMIGKKLQSNMRTDRLYKSCIKKIKTIEPLTVIFVNHLRGLEGLVDHIILPAFNEDVMEERFHIRRNGKGLEPGEKDIIKNYERYLTDWKNWALRNQVSVEYLNDTMYLSDSVYLEKFIKSFKMYESLKRS